MTTPSSPPSQIGLGAACIEMFFALLRGLARLSAYSEYADSPQQLEYVKLQSAVEHLGRGVPLNAIGESYLERVNQAPPEMLEKVLAEFGFTAVDVENWRRDSSAKPPTKEAA